MAKGRIVVALVGFERTIAEGRDVCGAVSWLQKREAGEQRNKNQRECVRFHGLILPLLLSTSQLENDTNRRDAPLRSPSAQRSSRR